MGERGKSVFYILGVIIILGLLGTGVYAAVNTAEGWHSGNAVSISTGTGDDVQDSIDAGVLRGDNVYTDVIPAIVTNPGHSPDEIWVSVNTQEKTLATALTISNGLCGDTNPSTIYSSLPSGAYHLATEIEVIVSTSTVSTSAKSLQDAINDGDFCIPAPVCFESMEFSCGIEGIDTECTTQGATFNCAGDCVGSDGSSVAIVEGAPCYADHPTFTPQFGFCNSGGSCVPAACNPGTEEACSGLLPNGCQSYGGIRTCGSDGTWGACSETNDMPRGTTCGTTGYEACDGSGNCVGDSSSGCGACPYSVGGNSYYGIDKKRYCYTEGGDLSNNLARWKRYKSNVLARLTTTLESEWQPWIKGSPVCESYICEDWGIFGCKEDRVWHDNPWEMKPVGETCGSGGCQSEFGETCVSCSTDCGVCPDPEPDCNYNGVCDTSSGETSTNCLADCPATPPPTTPLPTTDPCANEGCDPSSNTGDLVCEVLFYASYTCEAHPVSGCGACTPPEGSTDSCTDGCTLNAQQCSGSNAVQVCTQFLEDNDDCTEWSTTSCASGSTCKSATNSCTSDPVVSEPEGYCVTAYDGLWGPAFRCEGLLTQSDCYAISEGTQTWYSDTSNAPFSC